MKRLIIVAIAMAMSAPLLMTTRADAKPKTQKITGWASDDKCGLKGADASHADCAKKCVTGGASIIVISDKDKKIYKIDNQDALKDHVGDHVQVTGAVTGDSIHVDKVAIAKVPKPKKS